MNKKGQTVYNYARKIWEIVVCPECGKTNNPLARKTGKCFYCNHKQIGRPKEVKKKINHIGENRLVIHNLSSNLFQIIKKELDKYGFNLYDIKVDKTTTTSFVVKRKWKIKESVTHHLIQYFGFTIDIPNGENCEIDRRELALIDQLITNLFGRFEKTINAVYCKKEEKICLGIDYKKNLKLLTKQYNQYKLGSGFVTSTFSYYRDIFKIEEAKKLIWSPEDKLKRLELVDEKCK